MASKYCLFGIIIILPVACILPARSEGLREGFYSSSCPDAESVVRSTVEDSFRSDRTIAASLLRLHYHDCFVQGCDGSVLIAGPGAERTAPANAGLRGFDVIENAKTKLEQICPRVVSCADIVALAARDAVALSNGPNYEMPTGRRDGLVSSARDALNMPDPTDSIEVLAQKFAAKGLSLSDLVVLNGNPSVSRKSALIVCHIFQFLDSEMVNCAGAHTIGTTACSFVESRLYGNPDPNINPDYLPDLRSACPENGNGNARLALDRSSQFDFDTEFFMNLRSGNGALESDAKMYEDSSTRGYVDSYIGLLGGLLGPSFALDFADAVVRMGQIGVKTGSHGTIRRICSAFQ